MNRTTPDRALDALSAFAVLTIIGWPFLLAAAIAIGFLVYVARLVLLALAVLLTAASWLGRRPA